MALVLTHRKKEGDAFSVAEDKHNVEWNKVNKKTG